MVRERAARRDVTPDAGVEPGLGDGLGRRAAAEAGRAEPADQRRQVHVDGGAVVVAARAAGDEALVTVRDTGLGIADGGARAHLRGLPARRPWRANSDRGHGPRPDAVAAHRRAPRRPAVAGSERRRGSTFAFAVPLAPARRRSRRPTTEPATRPRPSSSSSRTTAARPTCCASTWRAPGSRCASPPTARRALRLARSLRPAAVLLDMLLPRLDGWDVLAHLKADPATAAIPVVIVSMLDERGKAFALGAAEYLVKPVGREEVLDALRRCVAAGARRRTVVVIDDDPRRPRAGRGGARAGGLRVLRAGSGEEGVRARAPRAAGGGRRSTC